MDTVALGTDGKPGGGEAGGAARRFVETLVRNLHIEADGTTQLAACPSELTRHSQPGLPLSDTKGLFRARTGPFGPEKAHFGPGGTNNAVGFAKQIRQRPC